MVDQFISIQIRLQYQLNQPITLKLCDFGFATDIKQQRLLTKNVGTQIFAAPETITAEGNYDSTIDIWGLGVIWCVMLKIEKNALRKLFQQSEENFASFIIQQNIEPPVTELIKRLLKYKPEERIKLEELNQELRKMLQSQNYDQRPKNSSPIIIQGQMAKPTNIGIQEEFSLGEQKQLINHTKLEQASNTQFFFTFNKKPQNPAPISQPGQFPQQLNQNVQFDQSKKLIELSSIPNQIQNHLFQKTNEDNFAQPQRMISPQVNFTNNLQAQQQQFLQKKPPPNKNLQNNVPKREFLSQQNHIPQKQPVVCNKFSNQKPKQNEEQAISKNPFLLYNYQNRSELTKKQQEEFQNWIQQKQVQNTIRRNNIKQKIKKIKKIKKQE